MRRPARVALAWLPVAAYMALIWQLSSRVLTFPKGPDVPLIDKWVHLAEYGVLCGLVAFALDVTLASTASPTPASPARAARAAAVATLVASGWGLLDELHQAFVPGRSAEFGDLLADVLGAGLVALGYWGWACKRARQAPRYPAVG